MVHRAAASAYGCRQGTKLAEMQALLGGGNERTIDTVTRHRLEVEAAAAAEVAVAAEAEAAELGRRLMEEDGWGAREHGAGHGHGHGHGHGAGHVAGHGAGHVTGHGGTPVGMRTWRNTVVGSAVVAQTDLVDDLDLVDNHARGEARASANTQPAS